MHSNDPPLIVHIIYRLDVGGLENGVVNLINHIPDDRYRHAIVSLTDATDFQKRIQNPDVKVYCLHKKPGQDFGLFYRLYKLLRALKPAIVHTRNLATLECVVSAWLARVPYRIHGEHGWDTSDLHGKNKKYRLLRRLMSIFVHRYIALSVHIQSYLINGVGIAPEKVTQLYNGVDMTRFNSASGVADVTDIPDGFLQQDSIVIGTVGRLEAVKDQMTLVRAFLLLLQQQPDIAGQLRLLVVGDGSHFDAIQAAVAKHAAQVWLAGNRNDVSALMQRLSIFVLPSQNEGISNTILEAMATGLPVVATQVGGNAELVVEGETGGLVPAQDPQAMAAKVMSYVADADKRREQGEAGRARVESQFSLQRMVTDYLQIYDVLPRG